MSDHEEIARRLRDEGMASAPPDLADAVMEQVRQEPRRRAARARRWRRPVLALAIGAAAAAAVVVGLSRSSPGPGHSGALSSAAGTPSARIPAAAAAGPSVRLSSARAKQVLGTRYRPPVHGVLVVRVPRRELPGLRSRLIAAAREQGIEPNAVVQTVTIRVVPVPR
jgi:hypothetical protein